MISILLKRVASLYLQNKTIKSQISTKNSEVELYWKKESKINYGKLEINNSIENFEKSCKGW